MKRNLLLITALLSGCTQIDTGNVGVERTLGNVKLEELPPGVYGSMFKTVDEFTTKEIMIPLENMTPKARDNLIMKDVDIDVYFKVDPSKMADLYVKYQGDVRALENKDLVVGYNRVFREAREAVYKAFTEFDATTLHTKRTELTERIRALLQHELDISDKGVFIVTNINARALNTDPALEASIRRRAEVDQQIEAKIKEEALAMAEAKRLLAEAEGIAAANRAINASLTPALLRLREIEAQQAIATKGGNTTILIPSGGAIPLLNVK